MVKRRLALDDLVRWRLALGCGLFDPLFRWQLFRSLRLVGSKVGVAGWVGAVHGQVGPSATVVGATVGATTMQLRTRSCMVRAVAARSLLA